MILSAKCNFGFQILLNASLFSYHFSERRYSIINSPQMCMCVFLSGFCLSCFCLSFFYVLFLLISDGEVLLFFLLLLSNLIQFPCNLKCFYLFSPSWPSTTKFTVVQRWLPHFKSPQCVSTERIACFSSKIIILVRSAVIDQKNFFCDPKEVSVYSIKI